MKTLLKLATALISMGIILPSFADNAQPVVFIANAITAVYDYDVRFDYTFNVLSTGLPYNSYITIPDGSKLSPDWSQFNPDDFELLHSKIEYIDPYGQVLIAGPTCHFSRKQFVVNKSYTVTVTLYENHGVKETVCTIN